MRRPLSTLFPYTTLFRSLSDSAMIRRHCERWYSPVAPPASCGGGLIVWHVDSEQIAQHGFDVDNRVNAGPIHGLEPMLRDRSEEHTSELQSRVELVCRLL